MPRLVTLLGILLLAGCAAVPPLPLPQMAKSPACPTLPLPPPATACPACPVCPGVEPAKPAAKPLQPAEWSELPGWERDDHAAALALFRSGCATLSKNPLWLSTCESAAEVGAGETANADARIWFEARFRPWALTNPDGGREGLVTGYYEPVVRGSRSKKAPYLTPVFGPPDDMIVVDLAEIYPELKHMRLRGRVVGNKVVPYFTRAEIDAMGDRVPAPPLFWAADPIDLFFLQVQGSGQLELDDGSRVRIGYADQNGHPYQSIGRWLVAQGELPLEQASMQGIKSWAQAHPQRLAEMLNTNPSYVFFREMPASGDGPTGALGVPLTASRSIAVDPRHIPLGAPVFLATTYPLSDKPLNRLMLAQDTGSAIKGVVRADYFWGFGADAGAKAGKMRQSGRMWVLLPVEGRP